MELHQLRSFITIVQEGSFTKAAEALFVTQSALSQQIKTLEQKLGTSLFERQRRRIYLTEAGEILLEQAKQMLAIESQIKEEIDALAGLTRGRLRIGTSDTTCLYLLPSIVQRFRNSYPAIEIHLTNRPSPEVLNSLTTGEIDFGIITLPPALSNQALPYESQHLFWREDVAICPPEHPLAQLGEVTIETLAQYPLLLLEQGSSSRAYLDQQFEEAGIAPRIIDLGSIEVIKRYVEINLGISIIPHMAVEAEVQAGRLQVVPLSWLTKRAIGWVQRRQSQLSPAGRAFYQMVRYHFKI